MIVEKSRRHECLEPTNASRLREEHKHSALLSALIHDSSSEEYESDHENLISSDEELQESTFFDFSEAPSKVDYDYTISFFSLKISTSALDNGRTQIEI